MLGHVSELGHLALYCFQELFLPSDLSKYRHLHTFNSFMLFVGKSEQVRGHDNENQIFLWNICCYTKCFIFDWQLRNVFCAVWCNRNDPRWHLTRQFNKSIFWENRFLKEIYASFTLWIFRPFVLFRKRPEVWQWKCPEDPNLISFIGQIKRFFCTFFCDKYTCPTRCYPLKSV